MEERPGIAEAEVAMAAHWGAGFRIERELGGGARNSVFLVAGPAEEPLVLRWSGKPEPVLEWEAGLLVFLHRAGRHVAVLQPALDGCLSAVGWMLTSFIEGRPPSSKDDWRLAARELSSVHELTRGYPPDPSGVAIFNTSGLGGFESGYSEEDSQLLTGALDRLRECRPETSVIHGDPGPANVLINGDTAFLIDWDEARTDYSCLDFGDGPLALISNASDACRDAALAWEVLRSAAVERDYAFRRLDELRERAGRRDG